MIRLARLRVIDEIENALSFYRLTFLAEIPRLYEEMEAALGGRPLPVLLRMGSWIGGDRDGNPFVTADVLREAVTRQARTAFAHYLEEVHALGAELSMSLRLLEPTPALLRLAHAARDPSPHRQDEPYRQALSGIYSRLAATARKRTGFVPPREPHRATEPYADEAAFAADLQVIADSLASHGAAPLAAVRLQPLQRALRVFGFHLAALDLRQNADVHEAVVAELLAAVGVATGLPRAGRSRARGAARARTRDAAAAAYRRTSPTAKRRRANWRSCAPPPSCTPSTARPRCRTTSSRRPPASPTCWKWRCCSRKSACSRWSGAWRWTSSRCSRPSPTWRTRAA